jgi:hypothetical protein
MEETAAQIGISVSAAKARVFHGKAALRKSKVLHQIDEPSCGESAGRLGVLRATVPSPDLNPLMSED